MTTMAAKEADAKDRKLFVGNLSYNSTQATLEEYFGQFGPIHECAVIFDRDSGKSRGFGFVTFEDAQSAAAALADPNPLLDGRRVNINLAALGKKPNPAYGALNRSKLSGMAPIMAAYPPGYAPIAGMPPGYGGLMPTPGPAFWPGFGAMPQYSTLPPQQAYAYPAPAMSNGFTLQSAMRMPWTPSGPAQSPPTPDMSPLSFPIGFVPIQQSGPGLGNSAGGNL